MNWKELIPVGIVMAVVAVVSHIVALSMAPTIIMSYAMDAPAKQVGWNAVAVPPRATAESRTIVRPSPDLLYVICPYDVTQATLRVSAPIPKNTYWSVALYADNTDNYFVVNDKQAGPFPQVDFVIYADGNKPPVEDIPKIKSPSKKGLVLFRTLVSDEKRIDELEAARRETKCENYVPTPVTADVPTPVQKPNDPQAPAPATPPTNEGTGNN